MSLTEEHRRLIQDQIRAAYDKGYEHGSTDGRTDAGCSHYLGRNVEIERGNYLFAALYAQLATPAAIPEPAIAMPIEELAAYLPDDVSWGEPITPAFVRHILDAAAWDAFAAAPQGEGK